MQVYLRGLLLYELKRKSPIKDRFEMELVGNDGNIFGILGRASRLLKQNGLASESKEMFDRAISFHSYDEALNIISEYVQTELSGGNKAPKQHVFGLLLCRAIAQLIPFHSKPTKKINPKRKEMFRL